MINQFRGKYTKFSNYSLVSIWYDGHIYSSVEHAYQAAKTLDLDKQAEIRNAATPNRAKKLGRTVNLRPDWEIVKIPIMEKLLREKFAQEPERSLLLSTGDEELVEGNWWGDKFWGVCDGEGRNELGKLLMKLRSDFRQEMDD